MNLRRSCGAQAHASDNLSGNVAQPNLLHNHPDRPEPSLTISGARRFFETACVAIDGDCPSPAGLLAYHDAQRVSPEAVVER